jgi:tRNA threonylcarbamoyl adenosine modification protein YeaZ
MALILCIETSSKNCSVCISENGLCVGLKEEVDDHYCHGQKLHVLIEELLQESNLSISDIDAFCLSGGPGSYTGLRIGAAAVKGFAFALNKPIIVVSTLESLAFGFFCDGQLCALESDFIERPLDLGSTFFCPVTESRQGEVYTALYQATTNKRRFKLKEGMFHPVQSYQKEYYLPPRILGMAFPDPDPPTTLNTDYSVMDEVFPPSPANVESFFSDENGPFSNTPTGWEDGRSMRFWEEHTEYGSEHVNIYIFGSGAYKLESHNPYVTLPPDNVHFDEDNDLPSAKYLCVLAEEKFQKHNFVDSAYFEPLYLKDFIPTVSKKNKI